MKSALRKNIATLSRFSVIPYNRPRNKCRKSGIISGGDRLVSLSLTKMRPRKCAPIVLRSEPSDERDWGSFAGLAYLKN